ncbi:hypothetical protein GBF38_015628 [Nibea albiflora]|uniref:Uncharacterized protein n=1 Tax=Nibea albiflora TaxID=240163 RepID=A0ACB7EM42_NIBAL|nr:hypothetical protein GBF38_015628 [Nibea albiflora]
MAAARCTLGFITVISQNNKDSSPKACCVLCHISATEDALKERPNLIKQADAGLSASSVSVLFTLVSSVIMSIEAAEPGYIAQLLFWHNTGPVNLPLVPSGPKCLW